MATRFLIKRQII